MENIRTEDLYRLKNGKAPEDIRIIRHISTGADFLVDFWCEKYLNEYISLGGSRIQFLTGRPGSGKTHIIRLLMDKADHFDKVLFSAHDVWLHDFKEVYAEIFRQCNIMRYLAVCSKKIIVEMGCDPDDLSPSETFGDYLSRTGRFNPTEKREIRDLLNRMFLNNPLIDNNFALACSILTGSILGYPVLEEQTRENLLSWLGGSKDVRIATIRKLGLSPARITKYNARHMLRSFIEIMKMTECHGLLVAVDDVEVLARQRGSEDIYYTKTKRNDVYESIRELIDEIDTLKNVMFVFSFDRSLMDDDKAGFHSYQALWYRIQNEISSEMPNRFANIVDLDKFVSLGLDEVLSISKRAAGIFTDAGKSANPIDRESAQKIVMQSRFGNISLPRQVMLATFKNTELEEEDLND